MNNYFSQTLRFSKTSLMAITFITLFLLVPSLFRYTFPVSSMASGVVLVSLLLIFFNFITLRVNRRVFCYSLIASTAVCIFLSLHFFVCIFNQHVNIERFSLSLLVVFIFIFAAALGSKWLFIIKDNSHYPIRYIFYLFLIITLFRFAEVQPPSINLFDKSIFPFTEPSFFAIAFIPILIYMTVTAKHNFNKILYLAIGLTIAIWLQNLTMVIGVFLATSIVLSWVRLFVICIIISVSVYLFEFDISYFTQRVNFYNPVDNISTLVYIQGWQLILDSLSKSFLWGLGFQQLGENTTSVDASLLIQSLAKTDLNLNDGGFIFAKLVSELGLIGIVIATYFLFFVKKAFQFLRKIDQGRLSIDAGKTFALSVVVAYIVELFIRGSGYFAGNSFLFISAVIYLIDLNKGDKNLIDIRMRPFE